MSEKNTAKFKWSISMLTIPLIGVYLFPLLALTSLYAMQHVPYTLLIQFIVVGWLGQWIQHKIPGFGDKSVFIRGVTAVVVGVIFGMVIKIGFILPLPDILTISVWGVISAYVGVTFQPIFRSVMLWRLQIFGVISAILLSMATRQIEFMQSLLSYAGPVYIAGVISFVAWIVGQYSVQLDRAILNDGKRRVVLRDFARANHQRLMWMLILIAGIGAFPSLAAWLGPLRDRLLAWIRGLFGTGPNQEPPLSPTMPNEPMVMPDEMKEPPSEPSIIWNILGWVVMGAVAVVILWLLLRLGQKVMNRLMDQFKGMLQPGEKKSEPRTEYMDISETLEVPTKVRKPWFRKKEGPPVQDAERVRYYYRTWIDKAAHRGAEIQGAHTPLEAAKTIVQHSPKQDEEELSVRLPDVYNVVRYGKKVPNEPDMVEIDRIWKSYRSK
ncbi:hypothetical protein C0Q44_14035 [Paenibacillus sp. PCH8]|uniref:DUF4129 domain-containing protein n=1 Tax=Paenibacillus sp. PCH8 TaxID=2066524 RepID=UPI000CF989D7|nr:DUF4129 domain-containing protein [Paenibacillus sp. PCH8]PQP82551.1 hypothetical protein C0Q44_14035 [Paenibacillus sp. PCH8]